MKNNPPGRDANYDLVKATTGRAGHDKVKHKVTVAGKIGDPTATGFGEQVRLGVHLHHHTNHGFVLVDRAPDKGFKGPPPR